MKLSFLIYSYFPYGGQQRDFLRIANECIQRGHEVDVYAIRWQGDIPEKLNLIKVPVKGRTRVQLYKRYTAWVENALKDTANSAVVGFNKMPLLDIYFAADPCFVEKAHTQRQFYYKFSSRYRHFRSYEDAVFGQNSSTQALILSLQQRESFEEHYPGCGNRLHELPPGISLDRKVDQRDQAEREKFRTEYGVGDDELLMLQVGSGFKVKGVDRSLQALASLPEQLRSRTKFMLVGQDKSAGVDSLAKRLGLVEQLSIFPGRDDIPRFFAGADLLIHPAYMESAGYVLLEATIAGLPVLTTATCGYSFHIEQAQSGRVCSNPFQQSELNQNLAMMLELLAYESWSTNGLDYGKQADLFSMPQAAADLIERFARAG
ncbi:MAG: glycosyltransferase family 4 protein [Pseudomonadota bacterium]|nr:glycosyltransferase family 4 protein [Pseudomonadota bacterium]